ncbi:helix-turn-helix domain-containing protein [Enterococcus raffinosus]|uniref:Helix-turn-helix transcriptional regulator n=1 Tax=Enterococcus raffinosus TaxID=71452 RepID=A0AAW8TGP1_9ENTE|nr:helix-turn-helix transcriptional regulator [Enterococcus raffinosus]MDT2525198.1 helix-turn-helix transcriptional regulator [Enterococcus raffinosus]MDT2532081.1 helix-turn-helix transcriptional regulator [Enterococcus raffinosus]MDT2535803.1 helix-turn-helix transcriptional regulator [Enterococcus raffinosus]MDT2546277.1 helix-turn-helix transcriptional regulator [Enterococcus raffinosus]MDT2556234.1 helix-turn-helix transcriptional regulator [Enterococcus raffinosus]
MDNFLGTQLKSYRQRNELTQKQLANILYVSDRTVSKLERGAGYPDIDTLKRIAQLLDISLDNLLNEREPELYFEYRSEIILFHLPLLHIIIPNLSELLWHNRRFALSTMRHKKQLIPVAQGIFSVGFFSSGFFSSGVFSLGIFTKGIFSLGLLSLGIFSAGILTLGFFSAGNLALGAIAFGNLGIGLLALGNLALGGISIGNFTLGYLAIGNKAFGTYTSILPEHSNLPEISQAFSLLRHEVPQVINKWIIGPFLTVTNTSIFLYAAISLLLFIVFLLCVVCLWGLMKLRRLTVNH